MDIFHVWFSLWRIDSFFALPFTLWTASTKQQLSTPLYYQYMLNSIHLYGKQYSKTPVFVYSAQSLADFHLYTTWWARMYKLSFGSITLTTQHASFSLDTSKQLPFRLLYQCVDGAWWQIGATENEMNANLVWNWIQGDLHIHDQCKNDIHSFQDSLQEHLYPSLSMLDDTEKDEFLHIKISSLVARSQGWYDNGLGWHSLKVFLLDRWRKRCSRQGSFSFNQLSTYLWFGWDRATCEL